MDSGRVVAISSAIISLVALALAIVEYEGLMTVTAVFAIGFGLIASKRCSASTNRFILLAAIATLVCTILSVTVFSQENLVDTGGVEELQWFYIMAVLHVIPLVPLTLASFVVVASVSESSYNWALVTGLGPFIAMGMQVPGFVLEFFFQDINLDVWMVNNGYILYALLATLVVSLVSCWLTGRYMRRNGLIITEDGMVPLDFEPEPPAPHEGLTREQDARERRASWVLLIVAPVLLMVICAFVLTGRAPGLEAGHPEEYLVATCVLWAIISLVLPILRLLRLVSLPPALVGIIYANIFFYVICLTCGLYLNVSWCGDFGHVISSTIVSTIVFVALCLVQTHSPSHVTFGTVGGACGMLFLVALSFGGIWEMMEGFTDTATGYSYMVYGATDTMGDLTADLIGVMIVTLCAHHYLERHSMDEISAKVRLGRSAFEVAESD